MNPNQRKHNIQFEINDLIDDAVAGAIARRGCLETLSDEEAARVGGGQTEIAIPQEEDIIYFPIDPICVPVEPTNRPIKFICPPLVVGLIALPLEEQAPLA